MLSTSSLEVSLPPCEDIKSCENFTSQNKTACADVSNKPTDIMEGLTLEQTTTYRSHCPSPSSCINTSITTPNGPTHQRPTVLGRNSARKNLSMEFIEYLIEYEAEIERLEDVKKKLQSQIAEEVKVNAKLQSDMETQKKALQERRLFLEQSVARLQEQLLKEKSSWASLEAGITFPPGTLSELSGIAERTKADLEELVLIEADLANLEWKVNEVGLRLNAQLERNHGSTPNICNQPQQITNHERNLKSSLETEVAATSESDRSIISKGANSAPSTLTRLTSKLCFLKERRSRVSNELQLPLILPNKSRGLDSHLPLLSPNKSPLTNKSRGYGYHMGFLSPNRCRGPENRFL